MKINTVVIKENSIFLFFRIRKQSLEGSSKHSQKKKTIFFEMKHFYLKKSLRVILK